MVKCAATPFSRCSYEGSFGVYLLEGQKDIGITAVIPMNRCGDYRSAMPANLISLPA